MADILHRVGVKDATPDKVYDALTTLDGLSSVAELLVAARERIDPQLPEPEEGLDGLVVE